MIIPLGKAVEEVLEFTIGEVFIRKEQCLLDFPHSSDANGHRKNSLREIKKSYQIKLMIILVII